MSATSSLARSQSLTMDTLVALSDLEENKRASGRLQDLADLQKLGFSVSPEEAAAAAKKTS
jgi:hypothetical protein